MFLYCTNSITQINTAGNKTAMISLVFGGVFSIILSIIILKTLIELRKNIFPQTNTLSYKIIQSNDKNPAMTGIRNIKFSDPKLHFYATCITFIVLFCMFNTITIVFFKSAFDIYSVNTLDWASRHLGKVNKAWSIAPIIGGVLAFTAAVFFSFKIAEDIKLLKVTRNVYMIHNRGMKSVQEGHEVKKHLTSISMYLWFFTEIISVVLCISIIIACIYLAWGILH